MIVGGRAVERGRVKDYGRISSADSPQPRKIYSHHQLCMVRFTIALGDARGSGMILAEALNCINLWISCISMEKFDPFDPKSTLEISQHFFPIPRDVGALSVAEG